ASGRGGRQRWVRRDPQRDGGPERTHPRRCSGAPRLRAARPVPRLLRPPRRRRRGARCRGDGRVRGGPTDTDPHQRAQPRLRNRLVTDTGSAGPVAVYTDVPDLDPTPGVRRLESAGFDVRILDTVDPDRIVAGAGDADALLIGYAPVTAAMLARLPRLR